MLKWQIMVDNEDRRFSGAREDRTVDVPREIQVADGRFHLDWSRWEDGKALGMHCLTIDTGAIKTVILPARGMGIWKCWAGGAEFGWNSPVRGPVHPSLVPVGDPSGLGWLEGFDELLVRCGLLSNGAPDIDASGKVAYPLHGRIANLPAHRIQIEVQPDVGVLDVVGTVTESRFLMYSLELESRLRFRAGSSLIEIHDTVTNGRSTLGSMQLLYHINLGQPVLQSGAKLYAPLHRVAPRDERAASGVDRWSVCEGPASGYAEQVYYAEPLGGSGHWTEAMLSNRDETLGYSVHFDYSTLPVVNFWKNTAGVEDGYVFGIEPATGFPNARTFEENHGRVVQLQGGQSRTFKLKLEPHLSSASVAMARKRIESLQSKPCRLETRPVPGWSPAA